MSQACQRNSLIYRLLDPLRVRAGSKALPGTPEGCPSADRGFPARDSRVRREGR